MPWLLSMRTKIRKLHKRKTVQCENHRMRTRVSANFRGRVRQWKVSLWLQSKAIGLVESAILRRVRFGPNRGKHGRRQFCALKWVCRLRKSTREFEASSCEKSIFRRRFAQYVIRDVLCEYASVQRKLQLNEWFPYFVVCVGLYDCARVSWLL